MGTIQKVGNLKVPKSLAEAQKRILNVGDPKLQEAYRRWPGYPHDIKQPLIQRFPEGDEAIITSLATAHSYEIGSEMNAAVTHEVSDYILGTKPEERVVLVEGFQDASIPTWETREEAIFQSGEQGAAAFEAHKAGVDVISPEPSMKEAAKALEAQGFTKDQIALFYTVRALPSQMRQGMSREQIAGMVLGIAKKVGSDWAQSVEIDQGRIARDKQYQKEKAVEVLTTASKHLNALMQAVNGRGLFDQDTFAPALTEDELILVANINAGDGHDNLVRQVARADIEERDKHILEVTKEQVDNGKRPLLIYGGTHSLKLAPAFDYLTR